MQKTEQFTAVVEKEIFKGDGGFTIALAKGENDILPFSIKGLMDVEVGQTYTFEAEHKEDDYGEFFHIYRYERPKMESGEEIIKYLSSSKFEGVGKRSAQKIVAALGKDALEKIKEDNTCLDEVAITDTVRNEIKEKLGSDDLLSDLYKVLVPLDFSEYLVSQMYQYFKSNKVDNPINVLKSEPYKLITEIPGYTFARADALYLQYGGSRTDDLRLNAFIKAKVSELCYDTGDTVVSKKLLLNKVANELHIEVESIEASINELISNRELFNVNEDDIMDEKFYHAENNIAKNISLRLGDLIRTLDTDSITMKIEELEHRNGITYSTVQKEAIKNALTNNFSIITGGPGTGKTTIIKAIATIFEELKYNKFTVSNISEKIMLCAPTGRAAQRMKQATGYSAKTIHSLLGWDPHNNKFVKGLDEPLPQELIIIDEFSMVDIFLAESLLRAIRPGTMVILVGDQAQLESVAPGNVMADLLATKQISHVKLDLIFRQGEGSTIAKLAKEIDQNKEIEFVKTSDMGFVNRRGALIETVSQIQERSLKAGYDISDIQVLYPKYKGTNGIDNLNKALKPAIIDPKKILIHNEREYQVGDKVMQLKNNHDKEIYNGDIGFIKKIYSYNPKKNELAMQVDFRGILIDLTRKDLEDLTHAYAISIHKSQGSEFSVIILPISSESKYMLSKKLIYTAVTRTKDKLIIVGELEQFKYGVQEQDYSRKTALRSLCQEQMGEEEISPFDFL